MGGPGSGRWYRWQGSKDTAEGYHFLDVRLLHRRGVLRPGGWDLVTWSRAGQPTGSIAVRGGQDRVVLVYQVRSGGGSWQDVEDPISLTWTPCPYGGQRPWFLCPGVGCGRRVAIVYGGRYFRCRHCYHLAYASQREDRVTRLLSKAQNIRRRLGGSASLLEPFPDKPKGMWWRTYERLRWREMEAHQGSLLAMQEHIRQFDRRLERSNAGRTR